MSDANIDLATKRDTLFLELLLDIDTELSESQLYLVRDGALRGHLACDDDGIDDENVRHRRLPLSLLSVACRTVSLGIPYFGPIPATDPCTALVSKEKLSEHGLALLPLRLGDQTVALLLGHPRRPIDRNLRDLLAVLVLEAAKGLGALIAEARAARRGHPPDDDANEGLGDDTINDAMGRDTSQKPPPIDVGAGARKKRKRRKTLSGHPGAKLIVSDTASHSTISPEMLSSSSRSPSTKPDATPRRGAGASEPVFLLTRRKRTGEVNVAEPPTAAREGVASTTARERRRDPRAPLDLEVNYRREDGSFNTGFVEDLSAGGLFMATGATLPVGERLVLTFALPSWRSEVTVQSEVRWTRATSRSRDQLMGVGLRFINLPQTTREAIAEIALARSDEKLSAP